MVSYLVHLEVVQKLNEHSLIGKHVEIYDTVQQVNTSGTVTDLLWRTEGNGYAPKLMAVVIIDSTQIVVYRGANGLKVLSNGN